MDLTIQTKALEADKVYFFEKDENQIKEAYVHSIGKDFIEVYCPSGLSYIKSTLYITDYMKTWALSKEDLTNNYHYVRLEQYFGSLASSKKYVYLLIGDYKIGDLVSDGSKYVGRIVSEETSPDTRFNYKPTHIIDNDSAFRILKDLRVKELKREEERDLNYIHESGWVDIPNGGGWCNLDDCDYDEYDYMYSDSELEHFSTKYAQEILNKLRGVK